MHFFILSFNPFDLVLFSLSIVGQSSYLMRYSSNLSDLLSFHTLYNITGVLMILLCCHWCSDGSARVSLVEYSSSLRTCSPRYLIIQYLNNPQKISPKSFLFCLFSYSSNLRTCSPRYQIIQYLNNQSKTPFFLQQQPEDLLSSIHNSNFLLLILSRGSPDCIIM